MERIILSIRNIVYLALGTFVPGLVTWDAETTAPRPLGRPQILGEGAVRLQATVVDRFLVSQKRLLDQPLEWCRLALGVHVVVHHGHIDLVQHDQVGLLKLLTTCFSCSRAFR